MVQIDWGSMTLAFSAIVGFFGWAAYFGLSMFMTGNIPVGPR